AQISEAIAALFQRANFELAGEIRHALQAGADREDSSLAKNTLLRILRNAEVAETRRLPMCQDTGLVVVFAEVGQDLQIVDGTLQSAVDEGVRAGTRTGFLRASVTADPIQRHNTGDNTPAIVHMALVPGNQLRLSLLAKGGGCENMSR